MGLREEERVKPPTPERGPLPWPPRWSPVGPGNAPASPAPTPLDPWPPQADKAPRREGRGVLRGGGTETPQGAHTGGLRTGCRCRGRGPVSLETVAQGTRRAGPGTPGGRESPGGGAEPAGA